MWNILDQSNRLLCHHLVHDVGQSNRHLVQLGLQRLIFQLLCGSASTINTFLPTRTKPMMRLASVVVLPMLAFWLAMATICVFTTVDHLFSNY